MSDENMNISEPSDEEIAELMGTTVDDQRPGTLEGDIPEAFEELRPCYLCTHEQFRHAPGCVADGNGGCMCSNYTPLMSWNPNIPDYADIQRLENMIWAATALATDYHDYAREYYKLGQKFTEDILIVCIEQYNGGRRW